MTNDAKPSTMNRHERHAAKSAKPADGPWTEEMVNDVLTNPAAVGYGSYPRIVSDEQWVRANVIRIGEIGAEAYLHTLLKHLRENNP